ncbi:MAG: hypothetical protein ACI855_004796, partial [Myxococcota bacterium]
MTGSLHTDATTSLFNKIGEHLFGERLQGHPSQRQRTGPNRYPLKMRGQTKSPLSMGNVIDSRLLRTTHQVCRRAQGHELWADAVNARDPRVFHGADVRPVLSENQRIVRRRR